MLAMQTFPCMCSLGELQAASPSKTNLPAAKVACSKKDETPVFTHNGDGRTTIRLH